MSTEFSSHSTRVARLSKRERDCLRLVYAHHTSKSIALELGFAKSSVDTYINRACAKLGLNDRKEAARLLHEHEASAEPSPSTAQAPAHTSHAEPQATEPLTQPEEASSAPPPTSVRPRASLDRQGLVQAVWLGAAFAGVAAVITTLMRTLSANRSMLDSSPAVGEVLIIMSALALAVTVPRSAFKTGLAERVFPLLLALGMGLAMLNNGYSPVTLGSDLLHSAIATWIALRDRRPWVVGFAAISWVAVATALALFFTAGSPVARSNYVEFWTIYNLSCYLLIGFVVYGVWVGSGRGRASASA